MALFEWPFLTIWIASLTQSWLEGLLFLSRITLPASSQCSSTALFGLEEDSLPYTALICSTSLSFVPGAAETGLGFCPFCLFAERPLGFIAKVLIIDLGTEFL